MLEVLKAGGAFVLLDPSHPVDRLRIICRDIGTSFVLSASRDADGVAALGLPVIEMDSPHPALETEMEPVVVRPDNAAYISFTSRSTGTPKGAIIEHAMLCTVTEAHGPALLLTADSRVFQFASYAFDASTLVILATLMFGGCISAYRQNKAGEMTFPVHLRDSGQVTCVYTFRPSGALSKLHAGV